MLSSAIESIFLNKRHVEFKLEGKSLINNEEYCSSRPSMEPCGTPLSTFAGPEV